MRTFCLVAACLLCVLLSACTPITLSVEDLMAPPRLSDEQNEVYKALSAALGRGELWLKYPRLGAYRSPFTFYDIDGDDQEEAMVFYRDSVDGSCRIALLERTQTGWENVYDLPGSGNNIEQVQFANLYSQTGKDIVISWSGEVGQASRLSIYRYGDGNVSMMYLAEYSNMVIYNLDADPLQELVLFSPQRSGERFYAQLIKPGLSRLEVVSEVTLNQPFSSIEQIQAGLLTPGKAGLVVDGYTAERMLASEVLQVQEGALALPLAGPSEGFYPFTQRYERVMSSDMNGDGMLDIPSQRMMPGYQMTKQEAPLYLTSYHSLASPDFGVTAEAFVNTSATTGGYALLLPERWKDKVSAVRQAETGEITFFKYSNSLADQSVLLLKIRTYSRKDYQDKQEIDEYKLLATKGLFNYYASIGKTTDPMQLTEEELEQLFKLL